VSAFGVQYDPGAGGIKFLNYPETEVDYFPRLTIQTDNQWHEWQLMGRGDEVVVSFDGHVILQRIIPPMGTQLGFRTWRGLVDIRDVAIEYE
jgi:hypothetical protein